MKSPTQQAGHRAESRAAKFLRKQGLKPVAANYRTPFGEIDLIMFHLTTLVFVEVRMRNNKNFGSGAESVTWSKQKKLINTAQHYIQHQIAHPSPWQEYRFDVVSIGEDIDWITNAFTLD